MIYSKDDVKRMLAEVRRVVEANAFFFKNDHIPPKVTLRDPVIEKLTKIEETL